MIRKILGWIFAILSVCSFSIFIMIAAGIFKEVAGELINYMTQVCISGFIVCAGISILLLRKRENDIR